MVSYQKNIKNANITKSEKNPKKNRKKSGKLDKIPDQKILCHILEVNYQLCEEMWLKH